jgi:two-component system, OmpR family, sensor kinase
MTKVWPNSVRWRLTLFYAAALGALLVLFAAASYSVIDRVLSGRTDAFLEEARDAFAVELRIERGEMGSTPAAIRAALAEFRLGDIRFAVYDTGYRLVDSSADAPAANLAGRDGVETTPMDPAALGQALAALPSSRAGLLTLPASEGGFRVAHVPVSLDADTFFVVAAQSREGIVDTLRAIAAAYLIAVPLFLLLAIAGGYYLARRSLAPVAAMSSQAKAISGTNLHDRLPVANPRDELGGLATLLNELLGRVEESVERQRRFVADASHELRTPVAIVGAEADVVLGREHREEREYRDAFRVVQNAGRRLSRIVDDLFLLARADAGHQPIQHDELYLGELVTDSARAVRTLAAARSIRVEISDVPDAPFRGDEALLGRMVLNLLDNAVKYSRVGSTVTASLSANAGTYEIAVVDAGPGIPADERERIFERFYRLDKARSRADSGATSGAGLGLSIARWIAEAHGGQLTLARSDETGSEFRVTLPIRDG